MDKKTLLKYEIFNRFSKDKYLIYPIWKNSGFLTIFADDYNFLFGEFFKCLSYRTIPYKDIKSFSIDIKDNIKHPFSELTISFFLNNKKTIKFYYEIPMSETIQKDIIKELNIFFRKNLMQNKNNKINSF